MMARWSRRDDAEPSLPYNGDQCLFEGLPRLQKGQAVAALPELRDAQLQEEQETTGYGNWRQAVPF